MVNEEAMALGTVTKLETLSGGTVRLKIDLSLQTEAERIAALQAFGAENCPVVIARQTVEASIKSNQAQTAKASKQYGMEARALRLSGFFRSPDVWPLIGSDREFREWVTWQRSVISADFSEWVDGEGRCIAAHVRRAGDSGTGYKADYSCVPLTDEEHQKQHKEGEQALKPKEWWDRERIDVVTAWGWETLKEILGFDHWSEVPPHVLHDWATERGVEKYLPKEYR